MTKLNITSVLRPIWVRVVLFAAALFAFVMAILPHPPQLLLYNPGDKVQHMVTFAVLAALARLAYPQAAGFAIFVRLSAFGAAIEVVQAIPALHRDADIWDWIADSGAILAVLVVASLVRFVRTGQF